MGYMMNLLYDFHLLFFFPQLIFFFPLYGIVIIHCKKARNQLSTGFSKLYIIKRGERERERVNRADQTKHFPFKGR